MLGFYSGFLVFFLGWVFWVGFFAPTLGTTIHDALTSEHHYENLLTRLSMVAGILHKIHR